MNSHKQLLASSTFLKPIMFCVQEVLDYVSVYSLGRFKSMRFVKNSLAFISALPYIKCDAGRG